MKKLQLIGVGTRRFSQITLEALEALRNSDSVCYIEVSKEQIKQYLNKEVCFVDLHNDYLSTRLDVENYKSMLKSTISQLKTHDTVSVVVAGHPRLGVFITSALEVWCHNNNVEFTCFEGISSFDVMANINRVDILENGTALIDINRALLFDYELNTNLDYYIYHVCSVANQITAFDDPAKGNNVNMLETYLLSHYPPEHKVYLIKASTSSDLKLNQKLCFQINELHANKNLIDFSTTLFVPALKKERMNKEILKKMMATSER